MDAAALMHHLASHMQMRGSPGGSHDASQDRCAVPADIHSIFKTTTESRWNKQALTAMQQVMATPSWLSSPAWQMLPCRPNEAENGQALAAMQLHHIPDKLPWSWYLGDT